MISESKAASTVLFFTLVSGGDVAICFSDFRTFCIENSALILHWCSFYTSTNRDFAFPGLVSKILVLISFLSMLLFLWENNPLLYFLQYNVHVHFDACSTCHCSVMTQKGGFGLLTTFAHTLPMGWGRGSCETTLTKIMTQSRGSAPRQPNLNYCGFFLPVASRRRTLVSCCCWATPKGEMGSKLYECIMGRETLSSDWPRETCTPGFQQQIKYQASN